MTARLARLELCVAVALLAAIVVLVFAAALMRFFGRPLIWSVDLAQLLFIWLCFLGAARALRSRAHLGVDLIVRHLPARRRQALEFALAACCLAFLAVLFVEGIDLTLLNRQRLFGDSGLSYAYVTVAVPVGSLLLAASILANMVEAWCGRDKGLLVFTRTGNGQAGDGL
ncbi:TRAP transporter small permease [Polymorphum gilvum]|uniref:TRAP transporter small permease protein n=1 Tax=Polymorphum gilvum (strain LMG 25793 / CGMCC 1.9160 / SL003B-26A1) TaxID=991905 RepID=F2J2K4_POLGS|nr:TRAP transporter small permease [Polymorphum gilvum]ADZ70918.1 TRAP-type C4-dicarboxylate transport system, small permease component [Polymorphum gilvum SL003B-26A1]